MARRILFLFALALSARAQAAVLRLHCQVRVPGHELRLIYSVSEAYLDLTRFKDGSQAGDAYGGHLEIRVDGEVLISAIVDSNSTEYGVIVDAEGNLQYANLRVQNTTFSRANNSFDLTFGRTFDDPSAVYWTDARALKDSELGESETPYPATCSSSSY
ncbi:MAG TPA: hypothetical protein PKC28_00605 [Bdellovibrionales bacterium]|nr:hypothetical protein [Bdellovibrionales bacterium]